MTARRPVAAKAPASAWMVIEAPPEGFREWAESYGCPRAAILRFPSGQREICADLVEYFTKPGYERLAKERTS